MWRYFRKIYVLENNVSINVLNKVLIAKKSLLILKLEKNYYFQSEGHIF